MNQMRMKFTGLVENKADDASNSDQKTIPTQKTQSFKAEKTKGQGWFSKFGRRRSGDYDSRDMEMEHAAAVAAAAFAIDSKENTQQNNKSETCEASLTKTKTKLDGTKSPISLLAAASKRLSGSFRSPTDDEQVSNKERISSVTDEKKPERSITAASSIRKSSTFTVKDPETPVPKVPPPPIRKTSTKSGPVRSQTPTSSGSGIADTKAYEWERTELQNIRERYDKLKKTIDSWENKKKVNAKRKLNKEEGDIEHRRMNALENFQTKMKNIEQIASGARNKAAERRTNDEQKAIEKANGIRRTGKLPGICSCF